MDIVVTPLVKVKAAVLDPFGIVIAEGELSVAHVPGIDKHTPSCAEEVRSRLVGTRSPLAVPGYEGPAYSLWITEV